MDTEKTMVVFRLYKDKKIATDCIALFPEDDYGQGFCGSYQHIGQHGCADYHHVIGMTRPATDTERADLKAELEAIGYNLRIVKRYTRRMK